MKNISRSLYLLVITSVGLLSAESCFAQAPTALPESYNIQDLQTQIAAALKLSQAFQKGSKASEASAAADLLQIVNVNTTSVNLKLRF